MFLGFTRNAPLCLPPPPCDLPVTLDSRFRGNDGDGANGGETARMAGTAGMAGDGTNDRDGGDQAEGGSKSIWMRLGVGSCWPWYLEPSSAEP